MFESCLNFFTAGEGNLTSEAKPIWPALFLTALTQRVFTFLGMDRNGESDSQPPSVNP